MRAFVLRVLVPLLALCVACGGSATPAQKPLSAKWSAPSMLANVPADSPYLFAILEPIPPAARRQTFAQFDEKLREARALVQGIPVSERASLPVAQRMMLALFDEFDGKTLDNFGRELGLDPSGRFVLYGLSVWPVVRVAVANEARVREVLARIVKKAGVPATEHTLQGLAYWQVGNDKAAFVVSVADGELIGAVLPPAALPQYLPIVLGLQHPPKSLNDNHRVAGLIHRYHFLPSWLGYVDVQSAADIVTGRASTAGTELDRPLRSAMGPVPEACSTDLDRLVQVVPRLVFGYRGLDARSMHATMVAEMPAMLVEAMQKLQVPVPELTTGLPERAMMRFGMAAELDELLPLLQQLTKHVHDHPFQCEWFEPLNRAGTKLADLIDQPLPPALHGLHGASFVLDDMETDPFMPLGHALFVADHAHDLLVLAMRLIPGFGGVSVYPDGKPVSLPLANLGAPGSVTAFIAARTDRVSLAVGPNSAKDVVRALEQPTPAHSPLMSIAFDMERMLAAGLMKDKDMNGTRDLAMQLEVLPEGLALELFATFSN